MTDEKQWPEIFSMAVSYFDPTWIDKEHPEGRHNVLSWHYAPFESKEAAEAQLEKLWEKYLNSEKGIHKKDVISDVKKTVTSKGRHRWWLTWFSHATYQKFDSDEEALEDFRKFVDENRFYDYDRSNWETRNEEFIWCPMGAEDSFRHEVCKCDGCKKSGIVRINH